VYAGGEILVDPGYGRYLSCHDDYSLGPVTRTAAAG
jgi:hypothetical protein